jgi:hypothetical protein
MRNRCTEAFGLCRSRLTVDAKVKCSSTAQLRFPDALRDPLTPHQSFPSSALTPCSTPPSTWTSAHDHPRKHLHQHSPPSLTLHTSPFRSAIALPSYHQIPTEESSAPRRAVDGGATPRSSPVAGWLRSQCSHRRAVTGWRTASARPTGGVRRTGGRLRGCGFRGCPNGCPAVVACPRPVSARPVSARPVSARPVSASACPHGGGSQSASVRRGSPTVGTGRSRRGRPPCREQPGRLPESGAIGAAEAVLG